MEKSTTGRTHPMTTTRIEGRDYTLTVTEADFSTSRSTWGEIRLSGTRGADYRSERENASQTFRFYSFTKNRRNRLPSPVFDGQRYILDGDTIRPATYREAKADSEAETLASRQRLAAKGA
jgi:hypothetical protein